MPRGGPRPNSGRPKTGEKTKCYTLTLPLNEAEDFEKRAQELNLSVNKYLKHLVEIGSKYEIESFDNKGVDDSDGGQE